MIQINDVRRHTLICEVCGKQIDHADLRLLRDVDAIPEAMDGHYVHKACLAQFMQAQGPSKQWERYDIDSPEAAWFLPLCTPRNLQPSRRSTGARNRPYVHA